MAKPKAKPSRIKPVTLASVLEIVESLNARLRVVEQSGIRPNSIRDLAASS